MTQTRHFRVTGRVQGVGFRAWTRDRAAALGLSGWVRNREDGSVEGVVEGPDTAVAALLEALSDGPGAARVAHVETLAATAEGLQGFEIRR